MLKILTPGSWAFEEPISQLVKVSSRGLVGDDLRGFVKRAGHSFADALGQIKLAAGEVPVHLIAVGAEERYGPNRNGDGFDRDECRAHHGTFQKHARWYRNHKNKDPRKSWGIVKLSQYNEAMDRIELLVALNGTKEAAHRNGGHVAEEELQKLAAGKDIPVSMACKVAYDVCSGCGQTAKTRQDYCSDSLCKYGGCVDHLGQVFADGHVLHRKNPNPVFFDISNVVRPADRIAFTLGRLEKAASAGAVLSGADLAELAELSAPYDVLRADVAGPFTKIAADVLETLDAVGRYATDAVRLAVAPASRSALVSAPEVNFVTTTKLAHLTRALADAGVVLPVEEFLYVVSGDREKAASAAGPVSAYLPQMYNQLATAGDLETSVRSLYAAVDSCPPNAYRDWATKIAADYSLLPQHAERRMQLASLRGANPQQFSRISLEKSASASPATQQLARHYALYKLASLQRLAEGGQGYPLALMLATLQNYS